VVNPPASKRRGYWVGLSHPPDPAQWLEKAEERKGSWWPVWSDWLARHAGGSRPAPSSPGNVQYAPIEAAPGRYVKERIH
jgi:polyhydroxyalkanoate synthase